jgi:hypothetical protein
VTPTLTITISAPKIPAHRPLEAVVVAAPALRRPRSPWLSAPAPEAPPSLQAATAAMLGGRFAGKGCSIA